MHFVLYTFILKIISRQKQKEKEAREEERKKREEAKEEEKRRKEEERLEAERKKQKAASNFASFFVSKKQEVKSADEESIVKVKNFMPFEIKADMRIAPICRRKLNEHDKLLLDDKRNVNLDKTELYLENIRKGKIVPRISSKTWPLEAKDDVILLGKKYICNKSTFIIYLLVFIKCFNEYNLIVQTKTTIAVLT